MPTTTNKKVILATTVPQSITFFAGTMALLQEEYEVQLLSSPGERLEEAGERFRVKTHEVEMYRRMSLHKDLWSLRRIIRVLRKEKPFMVHSMTPKAGLLCMMAAWWTKVPVRVHTFTGLMWPTATGLSRKVLMLTDKITCACSTHVIPEGHGVMKDLREGKITRKQMRVLGYGNVKGVDMERFSRRGNVMAKAAELEDRRKFSFIFVGRLCRDKGINELVDAFRRLYTKYPYVRLFLLGNYEKDLDPLLLETESAIASYNDIKAVGPKYGDELLAYYAASDCFVFPSYREGFPNTVMEAGAMELPSIVTDINGSREIIVDGENGIIIPAKNADALYEAMVRMIKDKPAREAMAAKARGMIDSRFEHGFVQKCLMNYYNEILK